MTKILITISGLHFHKDEGAKNRLNSFINSYDKLGFQVEVLLFFSFASFPFLKNRKRYLNEKATWYLIPSLPISKNLVLSKFSVFTRQVLVGVFSRMKKYSILQAEVTGDIGKYRNRDTFFVVDFHGDSVSEIEFRNSFRSNWLSKFVYENQKKSIKYANHIVGVSEKLISQLTESTGEKINDYSIISCGIDTARFKSLEQFDLDIPHDRIVLGYIGGFQKWQNIDKIFEVVEALREMNQNIYFVLFTNSDLVPIQKRLDRIGKNNYLTKGLSFKDVPSHLSLLDAGFLLRDNLILNTVSSPTKTAEYLASGVPVICTRYSGDYKKNIEHGNQGFVLDAPDIQIDELLELNNYLIHVKKKRQMFKESCKLAAEMSSWDFEFSRFVEESQINKMAKI